MKRIYLSLIVLMNGLVVTAQQEFYIFIQEPSRQPFYVRMGEESHSSSAEGHLILSNLRDSVYNLYIGFPRGRGGEHLFTLTMNRKDHGYELRNAGGRRQLFDLQLLQTINPVASAQVNDQAIRRSDAYSDLMAGVVDDTAVMYMSVADTIGMDTSAVAGKGAVASVKGASADTVKGTGAVVIKQAGADSIRSMEKADNVAIVEPEKDEALKKTNEVVVKADSVDRKNDTTAVDTPGDTTVVASAPSTSSVRDKRDIIRLGTENVKEGKLMIYVDRTGAMNDTIRIIIPRKL